jgi:hypothetical protein
VLGLKKLISRRASFAEKVPGDNRDSASGETQVRFVDFLSALEQPKR